MEVGIFIGFGGGVGFCVEEAWPEPDAVSFGLTPPTEEPQTGFTNGAVSVVVSAWGVWVVPALGKVAVTPPAQENSV